MVLEDSQDQKIGGAFVEIGGKTDALKSAFDEGLKITADGMSAMARFSDEIGSKFLSNTARSIGQFASNPSLAAGIAGAASIAVGGATDVLRVGTLRDKLASALGKAGRGHELPLFDVSIAAAADPLRSSLTELYQGAISAVNLGGVGIKQFQQSLRVAGGAQDLSGLSLPDVLAKLGAAFAGTGEFPGAVGILPGLALDVKIAKALPQLQIAQKHFEQQRRTPGGIADAARARLARMAETAALGADLFIRDQFGLISSRELGIGAAESMRLRTGFSDQDLRRNLGGIGGEGGAAEGLDLLERSIIATEDLTLQLRNQRPGGMGK